MFWQQIMPVNWQKNQLIEKIVFKSYKRKREKIILKQLFDCHYSGIHIENDTINTPKSSAPYILMQGCL